MKVLTWYFNPFKFCPDDIARVAVNRFAKRNHCNYAAFLKVMGLTDQGFKDAVAAAIAGISPIKGTTQTLEIGDKIFQLKVRKDGVAILDEIAYTCNLDVTAPELTRKWSDDTNYGPGGIYYPVEGYVTFPMNGASIKVNAPVANFTVATTQIFVNVTQLMNWLNSDCQRALWVGTDVLNENGNLVFFKYQSQDAGGEGIFLNCTTQAASYAGNLTLGSHVIAPYNASYTDTAYQFDISGFTFPLSTATLTINSVASTNNVMMHDDTELLAWLNTIGIGNFTLDGTTITLSRYPAWFFGFGIMALYYFLQVFAEVNEQEYNLGVAGNGAATFIPVLEGLGLGDYWWNAPVPAAIVVNADSATGDTYQKMYGTVYGGTPFEVNAHAYDDEGIYGIVTGLAVTGCTTRIITHGC